MKVYGICCHGLGIIQPIDNLCSFLNKHTPSGVHFNIVGGADPRITYPIIIDNMIKAHAAGYEVIFMGHSLGAMLAFIAADKLKSHGIKSKLFVSFDSTQWGSNAPGTLPYAPGSPHAGQYFVPDNVAHWIHYWQPVYPGGGRVHLAPGNTTTVLEEHRRYEDHINMVNAFDLQQHVLDVLLEKLK